MARKIGSRYTAHTVIGRGSAGTVWLGEGPEGPVAIKILREDLASDQVLVGRFVQERTALTSLDHPRVVGVHDLVVDGDDLALVMELVHGSDLRSRLEREGPFTPQAAVSVAADVAEGLAAAHAAGIIHRDVKPENILLDQASSPGPGGVPRAKLSDFGIARLVDAPRRTRNTRIIGTPDYLAPEIIEGLEPRAAVDIYALATVLYELLAGFTPFGGGHTGAVLRRHVTETVPPLPGLPEPLSKVLTQCLAKAPASRLRATELAGALRDLLPGLAGLPVLRVAHPDAPDVPPLPGYDPDVPGDYDEDDDYDDRADRTGRTDRADRDDRDERNHRDGRDAYGRPAGDGAHRGSGQRRRRGAAVPLVPSSAPDSTRETHTNLRRPRPEDLAALAEASEAQRSARGGLGGALGGLGALGNGLGNSLGGRERVPGGSQRSGVGGAAVRRRRRLLAAAAVVVCAVTLLGGYAALSGSGDGNRDNPGDAASPSAHHGRSAGLPQAPVAGQSDATDAGGTAHLPSWASWSDAPTPPAPLVSGIRALRLGATGTVFVFGTDATGAVRYLTRSGQSFGPWGKLTGIHVSGEPAPVALSDGTLRLFARGTDGLIYLRDLTPGGTWTPWSQLDGQMHVDAPPAAVATGSRIDLVARVGNGLATTSYVNGAWTAWAAVSTVGAVSGTPTLIGESGGRVDAFVSTASGTVQHTLLSGGLWHLARTVTGVTAAERAEAVQDASGGLFVFSTGTDYAASNAAGQSWIGASLPGAPDSPFAPAACADTGGLLLFRVTPTGGLQFTHGR
ncbi:protein kinase domain-containing protein [Streptacidiphilus fuscans]|uniref:protein kinase domain-containing protein n=1 Tax=Streptacidiphilus fuscans TaxID=2789292 RepID=UPI0038B66D0D